MCDAHDHQHIVVPPRYEDLEEEECAAFPPPLSPPSVRLTPGSARTAPRSLDEHPVGGLLLTSMEDRPMEERRGPDPSLFSIVEKLVSEKGLLTLYNTFEKISFKGPGHEVQDLETLLEGFQGWACQLYPHHDFEDLVTHLEKMGRPSQLQTSWKDLQQNLVFTCEQAGCTEKEDTDGNLGDGNKTKENGEELFV